MFIAMRVFPHKLKQEQKRVRPEYLMLAPKSWFLVLQTSSSGGKNEISTCFPSWPHDNYKNQPCEVVNSEYPLSKDPGEHCHDLIPT